MSTVGPIVYPLSVGAVRCIRPARWDRLVDWLHFDVSLGIRAAQVIGFRKWAMGAYSHLFWWAGETIWEASAGGFRQGHIYEYRQRGLVIDRYVFPTLYDADAREVCDWCEEMAMANVPYDWRQFWNFAAAA